MNFLFVYLIGGLGFLLYLAIKPLFKPMDSQLRSMVILNMAMVCYEIFFLIVVCDGLPHTKVYFGGGLADIIIVLILIVLLAAHLIALRIMSKKNVHKDLFYIPLLIVAVLLFILHLRAAQGNEQNDYMIKGNSAGLYYDNRHSHDE